MGINRDGKKTIYASDAWMLLHINESLQWENKVERMYEGQQYVTDLTGPRRKHVAKQSLLILISLSSII